MGERPVSDDADPVSRAWSAHRESLEAYLRALLGCRESAADCLQTTFLRLVETGGPTASENLRPWLFRVAQNCARQLQRRAGVARRGLLHWQSMRQLADRNNDQAGEELSGRERLEQARQAVRQLSSTQQSVLKLRLEDGLTFAEIARQMNVPLGTVLTWMRRGVASVRKQLGDGEE